MTVSRKHVLFAVSSHGYGHLAQCRSLIYTLRAAGFDGRISLQSQHDESIVSQMLGNYIDHHWKEPTEPTIPMLDALEVDRHKLREKYLPQHAFNTPAMDANTRLQQRISCDAVISNVGFLPLLAAQQHGSANAAFCCLNWADIVEYYAESAQRPTIERIRQIYSTADFFALTQPYIQAEWLSNSVSFEPLIAPDEYGQLPNRDNDDTSGALSVFISASNSALPVDFRELPRIENVHWFIKSSSIPDRVDISQVAASDYSRAFNAANIVITKPGYGLFTECAWRGKPVISLNRKDWPEQEVLLQWMRRHARISEIQLSDFSADSLTEAITTLMHQPKPKTFTAGNNALAAKVMHWIDNV